MVGMGSVVKGIIHPFALVSGNPARFKRFNSIDRFKEVFEPQEFSTLRNLLIEVEKFEDVLNAMKLLVVNGGLSNLSLREFFDSVDS